MKCLLNPSTGEVRRVPADEGYYLRSIGWTYCTKALWKTYRNAEVRPFGNVVKVQRSIRRV